MRLLILDNSDSYTLSLLSILPFDASTALVIPSSSLNSSSHYESILQQADCIILGPGPGDPSDLAVARLLKDFRSPILGVCLGFQQILRSAGVPVSPGRAKHGVTSALSHNGNGVFHGLPQLFPVTQYNSLSAPFPAHHEGVMIEAWADNQILACSIGNIWGLQFHPESVSTQYGREMIANFLRLVQVKSDGDIWSPELRSLDIRSTPGVPKSFTNASSPSVRTSDSSSPNDVAPVKAGPSYTVQSVTISSHITPRRLFESLVHKKSAIGEIWLDSATEIPQAKSIILNPDFLLTGSEIYSESGKNTPSLVKLDFDLISALQSEIQAASDCIASNIGFIGAWSYNPDSVKSPSQVVFASSSYSYNHDLKSWTFISLIKKGAWQGQSNLEPIMRYVGISYDIFKQRSSDFMKLMTETSETSPIYDSLSAKSLLKFEDFKPDLNEVEYKSAIASALDSIYHGHSYELCLTTQFRTPTPETVKKDPYALYLALRYSNPAPYSAFIQLHPTKTAILSSSPEKFLSVEKGFVEMKPIKGTAKRNSDPTIDEKAAEDLAASLKERAENHMIVDLCRHDLQTCCEHTNVDVPKLMKIESYATVHQLVSTITGKLRIGICSSEIAKRAFPPGSMTGAPKVSSVDILKELECGKERGIYSGAIGYFFCDGSSKLSVVIRTIVIEDENLSIGAGGAITLLSNPEDEWQEVITKLKAVVSGLPMGASKAMLDSY